MICRTCEALRGLLAERDRTLTKIRQRPVSRADAINQCIVARNDLDAARERIDQLAEEVTQLRQQLEQK